jgi:hypothetical protein
MSGFWPLFYRNHGGAERMFYRLKDVRRLAT